MSKSREQKGVEGARKRYFRSILRMEKEGKRNRGSRETPTVVRDYATTHMGNRNGNTSWGNEVHNEETLIR